MGQVDGTGRAGTVNVHSTAPEPAARGRHGSTNGRAELSFDIVAFMTDFRRVAQARGKTLHGAAEEVGIDSGAMHRFAKRGYYPLAPSLAAMCRWAGLDAGAYVVHFGVRLPPTTLPTGALP